MSLIGTHINSDIDTLISETEIVKNKGGKIVQLFVNKFSKKANVKYTEFSQFLKSSEMKCVVHASYTINIAKNWDFHSWWLKQLIMEINLAHKIDAIGVVLHIGKQLDLEKTVAINNMYTALEYVLSKTSNTSMKILLETSSGQGSEMFKNIKELGDFTKKIYKMFNHSDRLGICVDTCHIFAAGYDIRGKTNISKFIEEFDQIVGLDKIKLIHLNDSKNDLGSNLDRHENYDKGLIGKNSIILISHFFQSLGVPIILETPFQYIHNDLSYILNF